MNRLSELLSHGRRAGSQPVCTHWDPGLRQQTPVSFDRFRRDVARLRAALVGSARGPWVLSADDTYAHAVGLFALWHAGRTAILPPNRQARTFDPLRMRVAGIVSDVDLSFDGGPVVHPLDAAFEGTVDEHFEPLDPSMLALELFTSGTTGDEKQIEKRLRHLEEEVLGLDACWGDRLREHTVFSTASHHHLYGLLFGTLWPLCAGTPFDAAPGLRADELVPRMHAAGRCVLASVPTTLRPLAQHARFAELAGRCETVFSSGGPLDLETATRVRDVLGDAPIEVLGSTETGGIASRQQALASDPTPWTPLPRVRIQRDESLDLMRVWSPFVSVDSDGDGFRMADRIALQDDGRFRLLGRVDRVVKIGEKRLDLDAMASGLREHSWVDDVVLTTVERRSHTRVWAILVPSEAGETALEELGKRAFTQRLRARLDDRWDPVLHPRCWRVVSELPRNAQGKVTRRSVEQIVDASGSEHTGLDRPEVLEQVIAADFAEQLCHVPHDLECFEGHFPGMPVLPGVVQLDWVMQTASSLIDGPFWARVFDSIKFVAPITPGQRIRIQVNVTARRGGNEGRVTRLHFSIWDRDRRLTEGRVQVDSRGHPEPGG